MKILFTLILTFSAFWAFAQNLSENNIHSKDGKVYIEILVQQAEVESLLTDSEFCEDGTSLSFCFRNYVNKKLDLAINNGNNLDFIIEASLSNTKEIQINLSADTDQSSVNSYQITNNLFVDDIPTFKHEMTFTVNGLEHKIILDNENRSANIN